MFDVFFHMCAVLLFHVFMADWCCLKLFPLSPVLSALLIRLRLQDEASTSQPKPLAATSASAVAAVHAAAGGAKQLSKCKFKACKLNFSTDLNMHRCHMSHLPSARNAITKVSFRFPTCLQLQHACLTGSHSMAGSSGCVWMPQFVVSCYGSLCNAQQTAEVYMSWHSC
jgi:hypothetical protein